MLHPVYNHWTHAPKSAHLIAAHVQEEDDGDAPRLWVQQGKFPGTAFTRSIGDAVAEHEPGPTAASLGASVT